MANDREYWANLSSERAVDIHHEESETAPAQIAVSRRSLSTDGSSVDEYEIEETGEQISMETAESDTDSGVSVGVYSPEDITLFDADVEGNYTTVGNLLECGVGVNSPDSSRSSEGIIPLHIAVKRKHYQEDDLLNADAKRKKFCLGNEDNVDDIQFFHLFAESLLRQGVNVNTRVLYGYTLLHLAVRNCCNDILRCKSSKQTDANSPASIFNEFLKTWDLLLTHNADVNLPNDDGFTPLHTCARNGNMKISTLLLRKRARIHAITYEAETPLHLAAANGHVTVVRLLLEEGANADRKNINKETALHLAAKMDHWGVVRVLLKNGACVNATTWCDDTPLHVAIQNGHEEIVKLLLKNGAKINGEGSRYGHIPLHLAIQTGHSGIVDALLPYSACVNSKDRFGQTALDLALMSGNAKIVASLIDYGADEQSNYFSFWKISNLLRNPFDRDGEIICYDLRKHQVKMAAAGLGHLEFCPPINIRESGLEDFHSECQLELSRMKCEFIGNSKLSYYDILRKNTILVARHMKNRSVVAALEEEVFNGKFPIYAGIIRSRLRQGWARDKLFGLAAEVLIRLCDLPDLCVEKVLDFLDNDELRLWLNLT